MKQPSSEKKTKPELKMTSMIDVIFLLLIFFVCTANFRPLEGLLPTNLSISGTSNINVMLPAPENLDIARVMISFDTAPHWKVEGHSCQSLADVRTLLQSLSKIKSNIPVIIDSDANVPMGNVIDVYDTCRLAGLNNVRFAAKIEK
ncbi:MAG: ExbD/TolR family protein [Thermoguttaceae bacterium]